jgi:hypothetical protein
MTYRNISADGQRWIRDLMQAAPESAFPDVDPEDMTDIEGEILADYLRSDDGSLSAEDMKFSAGVANEILRSLAGHRDLGGFTWPGHRFDPRSLCGSFLRGVGSQRAARNAVAE